MDALKQCGVVSCVVWCGVVCVIVVHGVVWCCVAPRLPCMLARARVCVCGGVFIYMCVLEQIERRGVCEISHKWNLDVAENRLHLKTSTIPRFPF
jgi:hypothetical protein